VKKNNATILLVNAWRVYIPTGVGGEGVVTEVRGQLYCSQMDLTKSIRFARLGYQKSCTSDFILKIREIRTHAPPLDRWNQDNRILPLQGWLTI
jgi:hypothetical protein